MKHVRQLHLVPRIVDAPFTNFAYAFPGVEKLACGILMLKYCEEDEDRDGGWSGLTELRLLDSGEELAEMTMAYNCKGWPALRRLRIELASFHSLEKLDAFAELPTRWQGWLDQQPSRTKRHVDAKGLKPQLEFTSLDLLRPGLAQLPDLQKTIEHLKKKLPLGKMIVTLWGFRLENDSQTTLLYTHLRNRQANPVAEEIFDW